jgi:hypothetical protein
MPRGPADEGLCGINVLKTGRSEPDTRPSIRTSTAEEIPVGCSGSPWYTVRVTCPGAEIWIKPRQLTGRSWLEVVVERLLIPFSFGESG